MGMKRTVPPVAGETAETYWRRIGGRFLDSWYKRSLEYMRRNMPQGLELDWVDGNYIVRVKIAPHPKCATCGGCARVTETITGVQIPYSEQWYQCIYDMAGDCLDGASMTIRGEE